MRLPQGGSRIRRLDKQRLGVLPRPQLRTPAAPLASSPSVLALTPPSPRPGRRQVTLRFFMTRMLPVGLFMSLTLWTGNLVYLYLTVSFIQMLKVGRG